MEQRFETFTQLISKITRNIRRIKTEEVAELGLKSPHVSCLYSLYKSENGLTASKICDLCDEDKAAISRSLDYLVKSDFIECCDLEKKKYKNVYKLTIKGLEVAEKIAKKIDKIVEEASSGITDESREILYNCLNQISNNLQEICDNYGGKTDER